MNLRSWLIIEPFSSPSAAGSSSADAVIIDLRAPESETHAAEFVEGYLAEIDRPPLSVLLPPTTSARHLQVIPWAMQMNAHLLVLPEVENGAMIQRLDVLMRAAEARLGSEHEAMGIVALSNATGILNPASFRHASRRLRAISWNINCEPDSDSTGFARASIALAAQSSLVPAIDTLSDTDDLQRFESECVRARQAGFAGKLSRRLDHIPVINRIFGNQPPAPGGRVI